jgi:hypothetical protein
MVVDGDMRLLGYMNNGIERTPEKPNDCLLAVLVLFIEVSCISS